MIVITAPTGQIGRQAIAELLDRDEPVRVIARDPARLPAEFADRIEVLTGSHADPGVLERALDGADALLWLVPPGHQGASTTERYLEFTRPAAEVIRSGAVSHVVGVSSAGHGWDKPAGVLSAAFAMDAELAAAGAAYRALSMPFYMENLLRFADAIREQGSFALANRADRPLPLIATRDVARVAADLLSDRSWTGQENVPLFSPDELTPVEMATVVGEVIGRPVSFVQLSGEDVETAMRERGASAGVARDMRLMSAAADEGIYDADRRSASRTPTSFRTWCQEVLAPAIQAASNPRARRASSGAVDERDSERSAAPMHGSACRFRIRT